ncbi:MAG: hypothetical protein VZR24_07870 [Butyrivibrio hungatei]|nr:hypothetical protein [Butyrivibrio hungatei]
MMEKEMIGFTELSVDEALAVDGGDAEQAAKVFAGTMLIAGAPIVAAVPGGQAAGVGMALTGAGIIGKATGAF